MSANLLSGLAIIENANTVAQGDGTYLCKSRTDTGTGYVDVMAVNLKTDVFTTNQTVRLAVSLSGKSGTVEKNQLWMYVRYVNSAGNVNYTGRNLSSEMAVTASTGWTRFELSTVIPSGMYIDRFAISDYGRNAEFYAANPCLSYGGPVTLASGSVTLYQAAEVASVTTWYAAGTTKPQPPTTMEPDGWSQTQPALDVTKTTTLYECQRTVLTTGEYAWGQVSVCSDYEAAKAAYNKAASLDASLDATGVFNRLTGGGKDQGIYRGDDGRIYVNATYIKSGQLTADVLKGGRVVSDDGRVVFDLATGDIYSFDSDGNGFVLKDGTLQLTTHSIWDSSGDPAYGLVERMSKIFGIDGMTVVGSSGVGIGTSGANADEPVPNTGVGDMSGFFVGGTKDGDAWLNVGQKLIVCFGKVADSSDAEDTVPPFIVFGGDMSGATKAGAMALRNLRSLDIVTEALRVSGSVSMSTPLPTGSGGTGNANGTVARLTTPRKIRTNLASATAASFDGSADVTPGVTGVLPVANGGTGVTTDKEIALKAWPVGSVYISFSTTSPASLFGGTWTRLTDVFLYATAGSSTNATPAGSHRRTFTVEQMPKHAHGFVTPVMEWGTKWMSEATNVGSLTSATWKTGGWNGSDHSGSPATTTASAGGGGSVNIDPKYVSVFAWRRER